MTEKKEQIATRVAYGKTLAELGKENPNIVVLDADLSGSTQTKFFAKEFPDRFFNMGVAEQNMIGVAAGLASTGKIPFASSFAMFACGRAWEIVRNAVCHNQFNVKICATHAGLTVGEDGGSHQIIEDIAIMRVIPHMTVIVPADATEAKLATRNISEFFGPVYMRLGRSNVPVIFDENKYEFKIGRAPIVKAGIDVSIFACGVMLSRALWAQEILQNEGISAEVINISTIKPLDKETILMSVRKTGCAVTCEEHNIHGGLGDAIAGVLVEHNPVPMKKIGVMDQFGQSGKADELLIHYGLTKEKIAEAATEVIKLKNAKNC
ncbi:MAG: transketolase [Candidatus Melainabacteria bacterium RIFCSPHIGHO2_02_FULL_34_12]|nr:MAG: transketolase [Candidatus Melainabacteria bacterium RIFCSPHIGHO2_02_FULL_34_12]